jgi:hypothetical protein
MHVGSFASHGTGGLQFGSFIGSQGGWQVPFASQHIGSLGSHPQFGSPG